MCAASRRAAGQGARHPRRIFLLAVLATPLLASCAPRIVQPPDLGALVVSQRYERALENRVRVAAAVESEMTMWAEVGERRMPGAEARILLAAPDACRLWVGSLFGTALHLGAAGDSLAAYMPSRRVGLRLDAAREPIGVRHPGGLAVQVLSATWRPPDSAWDRGSWSDSLYEVDWLQGRDTMRLAVGTSGLPKRAAVRRPGRDEIRALYHAWTTVDGVPWPTRIELGDDAGEFRVELKASRTQFSSRVARERFHVRIPPNADTITLGELRALLERLGAF
jgi:hypothetical protein